jgi:hypothetical protein
MSEHNKIKIPKLILHAGLHKTGTTTLQHGLSMLRSALHSKGVALLIHDQMRYLPSEKGWNARRIVRPELADKFASDVQRLVHDEISRIKLVCPHSCTQLLISNERMSGARMPTADDFPVFRPQIEKAIAQLISLFDTEEVRVVVYVRRQDHFFESTYLWEIQKGYNHSIEEQFPFIFETAQFAFMPLIERIK